MNTVILIILILWLVLVCSVVLFCSLSAKICREEEEFFDNEIKNKNMRQKVVKHEKIELCRNCHGEGVVEVDPITALSTPERCPVCQGSGLIKKTKDITITIEPYTNDNSDRL